MPYGESDVILGRLMGLHPKIIDLTLDRVWRLLDALGNPQLKMPPVVHVAGTNGKGSTIAMLRAGIEGAGQSAHVYTSPHLVRFHERIRLAGSLIDEDDLAALLEDCEAANDGTPITYFEITTCAAILAFAREQADYTLLEVGLGGRLDATNVIDDPALTVITPVSIDHQQFLGETIEEIAFEKAGILKRGVTCVVGPQEDGALEVIERQAAKVGAKLLVHGQHWHAFEERGRLVVQDETGLADLPMPNLPGAHQIQNAGAAVVALRALGFDDRATSRAVSKAEWPARMQRLTRGPLSEAAPKAELWLDGGHNAAAGKVVADVLAKMPKKPTYLICGMLNTKDPRGFLRPLVELSEGLTGVSIPNATATFTAEETRKVADAAGMQADTAPSVDAAVAEIVRKDPAARILICGSLYLAGDVLAKNG
ncbi:bifunctional folylpolyglutamate synthase/dihydrofolate synthase [Chachezhania antarctica]|uniref:bifunctional folylpolyglutamate synthase/dihydrofolate synthase n=1 Tax=Chachezhania antarctica TaxID=2340860 RepID=UPI000EB4FDD6|nr:folylpolyglutamate synthase/dihydrofolate synthase family protein [Chachezhania antarctica]|tara:strand:+ start:1561 stop:2835 length:1275 start_codon:yes stop_codon:yes gene_type:complete